MKTLETINLNFFFNKKITVINNLVEFKSIKKQNYFEIFKKNNLKKKYQNYNNILKKNTKNIIKTKKNKYLIINLKKQQPKLTFLNKKLTVFKSFSFNKILLIFNLKKKNFKKLKKYYYYFFFFLKKYFSFFFKNNIKIIFKSYLFKYFVLIYKFFLETFFKNIDFIFLFNLNFNKFKFKRIKAIKKNIKKRLI